MWLQTRYNLSNFIHTAKVKLRRPYKPRQGLTSLTDWYGYLLLENLRRVISSRKAKFLRDRTTELWTGSRQSQEGTISKHKKSTNIKSQSIPANLHGSVQKDKAKTERPDCKPDGTQEGQGKVWNKITNLSRSWKTTWEPRTVMGKMESGREVAWLVYSSYGAFV